MKKVGVVVGALGLLVLAPLFLVVVVISVVLGVVSGGPTFGAGGTGSSANDSIPPAMLGLYHEAAGECPGLDWRVLAAIGTVESANGTSALPGVHSGSNPAGAEGPMQFEPATFAQYSEPVPPGGVDPASPYDPIDAVYSAARMLCANGAGDPARLASAVLDYNHSGSYVAAVLSLARSMPP